MKKIFFLTLLASFAAQAQVTVTIDANAETHTVSPYLYGRNNSLSDDPSKPLSNADWTRLKDSGLTFLRESGGNNCTKYNWRRKLTSHPDWYNNVSPHDWDFAAQSLQQKIPSAQGMWSFQLLGKAAKTSSANFGDWNWNTSQWWQGVNQNLAGGGTANPALWSQVTNPGNASSTTSAPGNSDLYLEDWTADSTTAILNHWFTKLSLNKNKLVYWNMDNEVEIWSGTHDDVMPTQEPAEDFMQQYFAVAKKARTLFPEIKLVGPVTANEWQWYNWNNNTISSGGKNYPWLEFFIKRVAEEQQASGVRLLDVLDIHFYPGSPNTTDLVQYHRVFFDKNYVFPEANGVKRVLGGWDNSQTKEYIFERVNDWLDQYMGAGHGVTLGLTEAGIPWVNANTSAVWYAGTLGEFMRHPEVEIFTPWTWQTGMWEVLHLFARYNQEEYLAGTSSDEVNVSAYPTINVAGDSITVVLVNRAAASKTANISFNNFALANQSFQVLKLASLTSSETFTSHTNNALQKSTITATDNKLSATLPAMSITTILLKGTKGEVVTGIEDVNAVLNVYPNPTNDHRIVTVDINKTGNATLDLTDITGQHRINFFTGKIDAAPWHKPLDLSGYASGVYLLKLRLDDRFVYKKLIIAK